MSTPMFAIRNLNVAYGNVVAVRDVSLEVPKGSLVALLGPNGAGKTSLLGKVAGLLPATSGQVLLEGNDLSGLPAQRVARRGIRLVPETRALFPDMTVLENLQVGVSQLPRTERASSIDSALDLFPRLRERSQQPAGTMSGGEQQMLSIARALVAKPKVLLLDEPSMGLAPLIVASIVAAIGKLRDEGLTVLVAEQNARAVLPVADRAVIMTRGRVDFEGTAQQVAQRIEETGYLGVSADPADETPAPSPAPDSSSPFETCPPPL
ncbi:MAG TPA: ABC transporter ATP-binding protein [Nocardioidaceae bacterium]|nr:ABC transporter ATP-binding protein [Nocardioidaceae bacterium]